MRRCSGLVLSVTDEGETSKSSTIILFVGTGSVEMACAAMIRRLYWLQTN